MKNRLVTSDKLAQKPITLENVFSVLAKNYCIIIILRVEVIEYTRKNSNIGKNK